MAEFLSPNYGKAANLATDVLINYSNGVLPIDLSYIISNIPDLGIMTFTEWYESLRPELPEWATTKDDLIAPLGSSDSVLMPGSDQFLLLYNEEFTETRCRWNIAHELGHYFLCHVKDDYELYNEVQEKEANCFARHLLTPFQLVWKIAEFKNARNAMNLCNYFSVSHYVMEYTINNMNKYGRVIINEELQEKFKFYLATQKLEKIS